MIQLQTLNSIIANQDISFVLQNNLNVDYFSDYKEEFNFIKQHIDLYNKIPDIYTFKSKFPNFEIIKVNETNQYLLKELVEDKNTRDIAKAFNKVRDLLTEGKSEEALKVYRDSVEHINSNQTIHSVDILKDISRYDAYVDRLSSFDKYYVKTGFDELDKIIGGWDREEELATIVARTNVGKSWVLSKCVVAAAQQGLKVGLYSGEMSERKVGYRVDTLLGHISNKGLIRGEESIQNDYKRYLDNISTLVSGSINVLTPTMVGGPVGVNALRTFIENEHLDILFIDQHSLLEDDRKGRTATDKASNISKDLKNLQVMKRIPIISVSQQNRNDSDDKTALVAQSDRISQDSTILLFLTKKDDILTVHLEKSRDSEKDLDLTYCVDFNYGTFTFIPDSDNPDDNISADYSKRYEPDTGENVF